MKVELLIRWMKPKSKEREEQEKHRKYLQENLGLEPEEELEPESYDEVYSYDPMTLDIEDIARYNRVDSRHTTLTFKDGMKYVAKIDYESFQAVMESLTQNKVLIINTTRNRELKDY